jgi:hypothetical protein
MKRPIEPTPHMVRIAKRWRRECEQLDRLNEQGGGPSPERFRRLVERHDETSHDLAAIAGAALVLYGWLPLPRSTKRARKKR